VHLDLYLLSRLLCALSQHTHICKVRGNTHSHAYTNSQTLYFSMLYLTEYVCVRAASLSPTFVHILPPPCTKTFSEN